MKDLQPINWQEFDVYTFGKLCKFDNVTIAPKSRDLELKIYQLHIMMDAPKKYQPLLTKVPNIFRYPTFNRFVYTYQSYTERELDKDHVKFHNNQINYPLLRHFKNRGLNVKSADQWNFLRHLTTDYNENPTFQDNAQYCNVFYDTICDEFKAIFKDDPRRDDILRYVTKQFCKVDNKEKLNHCGHFFKAIDLGARFDLDKIKKLIHKIDPKKAKIDMMDSDALYSYIRNSEFFAEMMKLNRYLCASTTVNQMYLKSDLAQIERYTNPEYMIKRLYDISAEAAHSSYKENFEKSTQLNNFYFELSDIDDYSLNPDFKKFDEIINYRAQIR